MLKSKPMQTSFFLSFEGIEGSGKTTQIEALAQWFSAQNYQVLKLREPGGTDFGEALREVILKQKSPLSPMSEALLFAASRAELIEKKILPHLAKPKHVVLVDRFMDSSLAYQGMARKLGFGAILKLHELAPLNLRPHLTFYLKIDIATSMERQNKRGQEKDYFEQETKTFYEALISGYEESAKLHPARIKVIDAKKNESEIQKTLQELCQTHLQL